MLLFFAQASKYDTLLTIYGGKMQLICKVPLLDEHIRGLYGLSALFLIKSEEYTNFKGTTDKVAHKYPLL